MMLPEGTLLLDCCVTVPATIPPDKIAIVPADCVWPATLGTWTGVGPAETYMFTPESSFTNVPAAGVWLATIPVGTSLTGSCPVGNDGPTMIS